MRVRSINNGGLLDNRLFPHGGNGTDTGRDVPIPGRT